MSSGVAQTTNTTTMIMRTTVAFLSLLVAAVLGADWIVSIDGLDEDRPLSVLRDRSVCRRRDCLSSYIVIIIIIIIRISGLLYKHRQQPSVCSCVSTLANFYTATTIVPVP